MISTALTWTQVFDHLRDVEGRRLVEEEEEVDDGDTSPPVTREHTVRRSV